MSMFKRFLIKGRNMFISKEKDITLEMNLIQKKHYENWINLISNSSTYLYNNSEYIAIDNGIIHMILCNYNTGCKLKVFENDTTKSIVVEVFYNENVMKKMINHFHKNLDSRIRILLNKEKDIINSIKNY